MAKDNAVPATEGEAPAKRRRASGPRQAKPAYVLFRVTDTDGNTIEGAKLDVVLVSKDANAIMEKMDSERDLTRTKITL